VEKFRTIVGEKKEEPKRELAEVVQEVRQMAEQTPAQPEPAVAPREATDVGQFMRFVASTIAKLPPEERTFVRFLIAPKATPLVMNDRMIDVIFKTSTCWRTPTSRPSAKPCHPRTWSSWLISSTLN
jgi:hypothetical protein